jgi:hypothetical protein
VKVGLREAEAAVAPGHLTPTLAVEQIVALVER